MVRKSECAYLCNGKCLLCKGECAIRHGDMVCADGVRRAIHHSMAGLPVRCRPFMGARGRHYAAIAHASGGEVYNTCTSKRRYHTDDRATKESRRMMRRYGKPLRSYYCRFCGGYHLTSKVTKSEAEQLARFVSAA